MTKPTYADYSALIDYLDDRATRADIDPLEGSKCYEWAEKLREDLLGLDPTSPLRPQEVFKDDDEEEEDTEDEETEDPELYLQFRDLVSDALQIIEGTITDEKERASWIEDARQALGEDAP